MAKYKAVETANRNAVTKTEPLRRYIEDRRKQKENPAPSAQPVRAWAVVDKDGNFQVIDVWQLKKVAVVERKSMDKVFPNNAPHRVIRVEIREVNNE